MRLLPALLIAAVGLAGCESPLESPGELTLATRNALEVLPPGATVVGMFNAEAARSSAAFETLTGGSLAFRGLDGEGAARFDAFIQATGFDPEEDLRRVYFAAIEGEEAPAFVVYADYDRERLDAYVREQPDLRFERGQMGEVPVYTHRDGDDAMAFALVNDEMLVASSPAGVRAMIDRLAGASRSLQDDGEMMALIRRTSHPEGVWVAVRELPDHAGDDSFGQAGRSVSDAVVSVGFERDGVALAALARTREGVTPADVADLVRGAVAGARMQAKSDPALMRALDGVRVRETSEGVEVQAFLDEAALQAMRAHHTEQVGAAD